MDFASLSMTTCWRPNWMLNRTANRQARASAVNGKSTHPPYSIDKYLTLFFSALGKNPAILIVNSPDGPLAKPGHSLFSFSAKEFARFGSQPHRGKIVNLATMHPLLWNISAGANSPTKPTHQ
ncbi:hypothetical protein EPI10_007077 [Gossypium australe]|uniref:Uncharacterized protein n=1 Tax=Gossypium australe TaxID=47621 RepID=A0A5B6WWG7_9ROSI|nr:hypothetical protein EPI10_007077 [Gossypium australe]